MLESKRDEEKRSKAWRLVMLTSTVVITLVIIFFVVDMVTRNPLEGEWMEETAGYYVDIEDDNELMLEGTFNGVFTEVDLYYTIDKSAKTISIKPLASSYAEAAGETKGNLTAQELNESLEMFTSSFDYSLENDTLTLTEREYGEQFIFTRVKK